MIVERNVRFGLRYRSARNRLNRRVMGSMLAPTCHAQLEQMKNADESDRAVARLLCADTDSILDREDKDFSITDLAGLGGTGDRGDRFFQH